ncbi:VOC family protein [Thalassotalea sp. PP2-459]|uniref:VOC family protein n=1 Tax=Thalassotalea sp. PP2-459 TaxID=1742724 RepID=UPI00094381D3|nr:VOC family protein [Thalassotalea sp. PP2-459]OKY26897.1 glyoxalase [Thalassotalea sp. PP2-459]
MIEQRVNRSICHASIGTNDLQRAKTFYQPILAVLGIKLVSSYEHAIAFGKGYPEFWVQQPFDKKLASPGNGVHFGFVATSMEQVDQFYDLALSLGGKCNGKPGGRTEYGEPYYGCFIIDHDSNKIEASYWRLS